ncbi:hypothetical protein [Corynebacterium silvaticum]|uniref:Uncharacterized protein n=1 Tax=Corynebacterium silvaticum TaxID=2320431 RepID=A0A7Y4LJ08_9CORY|nr:hypothetical protein [Corynebacterium silvaticum]ARU45957.1 hypothetical protein CBE74_05015 [Corynebacterium silvaticum]MBH5300513.1 hypothetical protein [Corynebacterium silvaticum]NOM64712.1 hypothetical protein [Corynebacterium silvaticum]NON69803.1 hypothetical protein [Corynebacterium silvaticum]TFA93352.1 hypothetical protein EU802_04195 [Corynebacterium silvaticum]
MISTTGIYASTDLAHDILRNLPPKLAAVTVPWEENATSQAAKLETVECAIIDVSKGIEREAIAAPHAKPVLIIGDTDSFHADNLRGHGVKVMESSPRALADVLAKFSAHVDTELGRLAA